MTDSPRSAGGLDTRRGRPATFDGGGWRKRRRDYEATQSRCEVGSQAGRGTQDQAGQRPARAEAQTEMNSDKDEPDKEVSSWVESESVDSAANYAARGRRFASLSDQELSSAWVQTLKGWAVDIHNSELRAKIGTTMQSSAFVE
jgi:hypothetical protein